MRGWCGLVPTKFVELTIQNSSSLEGDRYWENFFPFFFATFMQRFLMAIFTLKQADLVNIRILEFKFK